MKVIAQRNYEPMLCHFLIKNGGHLFFYEVIRTVVKIGNGVQLLKHLDYSASSKDYIKSESTLVKKFTIQNILYESCLNSFEKGSYAQKITKIPLFG